MPRPLTPEEFKEEVERRLLDALDVMNMTGLRSREGIAGRMRSGALPQPVFVKGGSITLWDRDDVATYIPTKEQ